MAIEEVVIEDSASGSRAHILPSLGFNCYRWQLTVDQKPKELLWYDPALLSGNAKPTRSGIPLLFPFAGRIRDKVLSFEGRKYDIADTLDDFDQPIHGYVLSRPWRVVEQTTDSVTGEFQSSIDDPRLIAKWPADYRIRVRYQLYGQTLNCNIEVFNPDSRLLPFSLGIHPYFRTPAGSAAGLANCSLTVPARYHWTLDEKLIPTHEVKATPLTHALTSGLAIGNTQLDDLLTDLAFQNGTFEASVRDPASGRQLEVKYSDSFSSCVVFIPPHREAICIEPYTSAPDAFRLQTIGVDAHLKLLAPGSTWTSTVEMSLTT